MLLAFPGMYYFSLIYVKGILCTFGPLDFQIPHYPYNYTTAILAITIPVWTPIPL